ncbi:hypothetical protein CU097_013431 [Rhizopus azygosporus]|uniref:Zn(2)-C6 fungal-type domain-containing protein n=1 Tax=Rhizopus azygosporus TaxID=86630 RepID=A0A367K0K2_RHIAZ|nr:hypothetical protein CU097_013431 [Rhizopus azygosporus]
MATNVDTALNVSNKSKCISCKIASIPCNGTSRPCVNCISLGKPDTCVDSYLANTIQSTKNTKAKTQKKGHRPHVPSACINCKIAHLACDVSRPCKRCVTLKKEDTCQDIIHKKRGRPKRREQKPYANSEYTYEIIYGTIETPAIVSHNRKDDSSTTSTEKLEIKTANQPNVDQQTLSILQPIQTSALTLPQEDQQPFLIDQLNMFNTTTVNDEVNNDIQSPLQNKEGKEITLILSMEVCCAKVPNGIYNAWGYYPQELAHRSLYDFISPKDNDRLSQLHRLLLDHIAKTTNQGSIVPSTERSTSLLFESVDEAKLKEIASGSKLYSDTIHVRMRSGEYKLHEVVLYIGGGLGADLYNQTTLSKQYIVAIFREHQYEVSTINQKNPCIESFENTFQAMSNYIEPIAVFSPMSSPITPPTPAVDHLLSSLSAPVIDDKSADYWITDNHHNTGDNILTYASLNRKISTPHKPSLKPPKFNIAPITAAPTSSISKSSISLNPLLNRFASSPAVTHPTHQYFLQTSSSTLNAAASAVKSSRSVYSISGSSNRDSNTISSGRAIEMSIRSLLC